MYGVVLALRLGDIWEPLSSEAGPLQGMRHHQVIEKWSVLLPYLVLFIDDSLLYSFIIGWTEHEILGGSMLTRSLL